ncbi:MAG TPA: pyrroloquinoline quinone-dependent dehydrogenase [Gemmatimonadaceae bacterium]
MSARPIVLALALPLAVGAQAPGDWWAYGRDQLGSRYSPLTQVTRENVTKLSIAWTFRTGEMDDTRRPAKFEATPLVINSVMYFSTPFGQAIALNAETGKQLWRYDAKSDRQENWGDFTSRGVSTWVDARAAATAPCRRRIFLGTIDARIIALDAKTGTPCAGFGDKGVVRLRRGLRNAPFENAEYELTSPPAVINGLIVAGSAVADNNRVNAASGEVRAFDARTGALKWTWDPVPRDSADPAYGSWRGNMAHATGAANAWSVIAADSARDMVFVPTGAPSPDYYGGERAGDNHYANSIVALRASTGKMVWHFQSVHHDLWDYDNASPPALVNVVRDGKTIPAVLQGNKSGQLFVLNRDTGVPIFPVEERPVPKSDLMFERSSPTQPFNIVLPALSPQRLLLDSVWGATPADRESCLEQIRPMRNEGVFTPPSIEGTVVMPSNIGGAHWGGVAYDAVRHIAVVPVNRMASMVQLIPLDKLDTADIRQNQSRLDDEYTRMHGTPYVMRRRILKAPSGLLCSPPPWGALVAISLESGKLLWQSTLGDPGLLKPEFKSPMSASLGLPNLGGAIVTAGGLVFIGATMDHVLRAFDIESGKELWAGTLPGGARATPMTYSVKGRQFVAVAVGGNEDWGKGDYIVVFALSP